MKKEKIIYDNQKEVFEKVTSFLKTSLKEEIDEAYLFGSLISGEFGKYLEKYGVHDGSDIDLIVFLSGKDVPKNWKYLDTEKSWWKLYRGEIIEINNLIHKIDVLVVKDGKEKLARKSKLFDNGILRIK